MVVTVALLLASAGSIYLSCELFVNGVEWLGRRLAVSQTATGTILAAFGTALPESMVTLVATAFGDSAAQREIGIGAAVGGPLALSTVAYSVVGIGLLVHGRRLGRGKPVLVEVDGGRLSRDQAWFFGIFLFKIALGLVIFGVKPWLGFAFLAAYACYVRTEIKADADDGEEELEPLRLRPHDPAPHLGWVLAQTAAATLIIFAASRIFVGQIEDVGLWLGLSPQVTALLFSPIATELPETMNAMIWVRQGRERLALANISGAMMIQATVPTAFGLFFTPWLLDRSLLVAAGATGLSICFLFLAFRRGRVGAAVLAGVGWLYAAFGIVALAVR